MMLTDEEIIDVIAQRMSDEVGWSEASKVFNHYGFVDVVTFLYTDPVLQPALIEHYKGEIASAMALKDLTPWKESGKDYLDWQADVKTRGGC